LTGQALKDVTTACNYFEKNAERMRYDAYLLTALLKQSHFRALKGSHRELPGEVCRA